MENKLVLLGGGGHCKSVLDSVKSRNAFNEIVIVDPIIEKGALIMGTEVIGTDEELESLKNDGFNYAFISIGSIGSTDLRRKLAERAERYGFRFATIIDPTAIVADSALIEEGAFIGKNVVINAGVRIGKHAIINTGAILEHESIIGDYSHVSVGTIICGQSQVDSDSFIGAGSTVIQCLHIGKNVIVGAGSTVLDDVEDNLKCFGIVSKHRTV